MIKRRRFARDKLQLLSAYKGKDRIISSHQMFSMLKKRKAYLINVKSLIPSLDAAIVDFRDGEVIAISGPTKHGKTLLAQTLTVNFAQQDQFPLWFSFEVPERQFLDQFPTLPKFYLPRRLKSGDLEWLEKKIYECHAKHGSRIVFIDHLHYVVDMTRFKNPSIDIGTVIRRLKRLAVQRRFIIFVLAHTVKNVGTEPSARDIRDSSFVPQESDCTLMIHRPEKRRGGGENASKLSVEFHRRTGVLKKTIDLVKYKGLLIEKSQLALASRPTEPLSKPERGAKPNHIQRKNPETKGKDSKEDQ